jgi:Domain of unknown function (DUF1906)
MPGGRYLWAHAEGGSPLAPGAPSPTVPRVAPIQAADKSRQEAIGDKGTTFGNEDGSAISEYIGRCIEMGELKLATDFARVYLEVDDATAMSADYWTAWCSALFNQMVVVDGPAVGGIALPKLLIPLLPCILCSFPKDAGSGKYKPIAAVTTALDAAGTTSAGRRALCNGFWAKAFDNAAYHAPQPALDWTAFDSYQQKLGSKTEAVPVLVWRHMDEPDPGNPVPPQARHLSLDATRVDGGKDVGFDSMLVINAWSQGLPTVFGVDKGADLSTEVRCLAHTKMTLHHLPDSQNPGPAVGGVDGIGGKTSFAFRYYSTADGHGKKDLSGPEARAVNRAGVVVVSVWQSNVDYDGVPAYMANASHGKSDAKTAFLYASSIVGQPANTPIYFSVDCNVHPSGIDRPEENNRMIPTPAQIKAYFLKVAEGYAEYLTEQGQGAVPYYTGVYACSSVLDMLYVEGLATHFWQAEPPSWGEGGAAGMRPNEAAWPHANAWQVCGSNIPAFINSGVLPCRQMSKWNLSIGHQAEGGTFKIKIGTAETGPIQLTAAAAAVANAVKQIRPAGAVVTGKDPDAPPADGSHEWTLFISGAVDGLQVLNDALVVPGHIPPDRKADQTFDDFVILNVAWGDTGGWILY